MKKPKKAAWECARNTTMSFEGAGYSNISGDFDGMGLSLGFLQWNFGQKTLQPLMSKFIGGFSDMAKQIMQEGADELLSAINSGTALDYAKQKMNNGGNSIVEPWLTRLKNLCNIQEFQAIQDEGAQSYVDRAISMCEKFDVYTVRAFCLFFDIAVQNGSVIHPPQVSGMNDIDKLNAIVNAVVTQTNQQWQNDVRIRKESIVNGKGTVHGRAVNFTDINDSDAFAPDIQEAALALQKAGVIGSPDYWTENAVPGKTVDGGYMNQLILNFVAMHKIVNSFEEVMGVLKDMGIVNSPDYWVQNAIKGGTVDGAYAGALIENIAGKL